MNFIPFVSSTSSPSSAGKKPASRHQRYQQQENRNKPAVAALPVEVLPHIMPSKSNKIIEDPSQKLAGFKFFESSLPSSSAMSSPSAMLSPSTQSQFQPSPEITAALPVEVLPHPIPSKSNNVIEDQSQHMAGFHLFGSSPPSSSAVSSPSVPTQSQSHPPATIQHDRRSVPIPISTQNDVKEKLGHIENNDKDVVYGELVILG